MGTVIGGPLNGKLMEHDSKAKKLVITQPPNDVEMKYKFGEYVWNPRNGTWNWKDL